MAKKERQTKTGWETSIRAGQLFYEDCRQCHMDDDVFAEMIGDGHTKAIRVVSLDHDYIQRTWLETGSKIIEELSVEMTLRAEMRSGRRHWYAYRRVFNKLHKRYVGTDEKVTQTRLLDIAKAMPST